MSLPVYMFSSCVRALIMAVSMDVHLFPVFGSHMHASRTQLVFSATPDVPQAELAAPACN